MQSSLSGKSFSGDKGLAKALGLNAAVVFQHIYYWIGQNRMNPRAWKEGMPWMYQTVAQLSECLEVLTPKEVRTAIEKLVSAGYLVKGSYARHKFDRTVWYRLGPAAFHSTDEEKAWCRRPQNIASDEDDSTKSYEASKTKYDMPPGATRLPAGANGVPGQANALGPGGQPIEIEEEIEKKKIGSLLCELSPHEAEAQHLTETFFTLLQARKADIRLPDRTRTAKAIELMLRLDGRSRDQIVAVMVWATQHEFWGNVILSGDKLRKQFDQLQMKMAADEAQSDNAQNRLLAWEAKKAGAPIIIEGRWVRSTKHNGKDLDLRMRHDAFCAAFRSFING